MSDDVAVPLEFTEAAANKVKTLIADEDNPDLKLRVYITGGGCSGFQYGFTFDDQVNDGDMTIEKQGVALVVDPMLATGGSMIATIDLLKKAGCSSIKVLVLVAAPEGIAALEKAHPDVELYTASIDQGLNEHGYIIPGLGDAGDKIFGTK